MRVFDTAVLSGAQGGPWSSEQGEFGRGECRQVEQSQVEPQRVLKDDFLLPSRSRWTRQRKGGIPELILLRCTFNTLFLRVL